MKKRAKRQTRRAPRRAVGLIGAGNMATALARGFVRSDLFRPEQLWVSDSEADKRRAAVRQLHVAATADNRELVRGVRVIVLAVKPQVIDAVLDEIRPEVTSKHVFVSIVALPVWDSSAARPLSNAEI